MQYRRRFGHANESVDRVLDADGAPEHAGVAPQLEVVEVEGGRVLPDEGVDDPGEVDVRDVEALEERDARLVEALHVAVRVDSRHKRLHRAVEVDKGRDAARRHLPRRRVRARVGLVVEGAARVVHWQEGLERRRLPLLRHILVVVEVTRRCLVADGVREEEGVERVNARRVDHVHDPAPRVAAVGLEVDALHRHARRRNLHLGRRRRGDPAVHARLEREVFGLESDPKALGRRVRGEAVGEELAGAVGLGGVGEEGVEHEHRPDVGGNDLVVQRLREARGERGEPVKKRDEARARRFPLLELAVEDVGVAELVRHPDREAHRVRLAVAAAARQVPVPDHPREAHALLVLAVREVVAQLRLLLRAQPLALAVPDVLARLARAQALERAVGVRAHRVAAAHVAAALALVVVDACVVVGRVQREPITAPAREGADRVEAEPKHAVAGMPLGPVALVLVQALPLRPGAVIPSVARALE
eukprot:427301-Rhodomonas_salina.3